MVASALTHRFTHRKNSYRYFLPTSFSSLQLVFNGNFLTSVLIEIVWNIFKEYFPQDLPPIKFTQAKKSKFSIQIPQFFRWFSNIFTINKNFYVISVMNFFWVLAMLVFQMKPTAPTNEPILSKDLLLL